MYKNKVLRKYYLHSKMIVPFQKSRFFRESLFTFFCSVTRSKFSSRHGFGLQTTPNDTLAICHLCKNDTKRHTFQPFFRADKKLLIAIFADNVLKVRTWSLLSNSPATVVQIFSNFQCQFVVFCSNLGHCIQFLAYNLCQTFAIFSFC